MDKNNTFKDSLEWINGKIRSGINEGLDTLISLIKENGGFLKTPVSCDKPTLYAFYEDIDGKESRVPIQGFHLSEELGLCICTDEMLDNYQYDTGYQFEYYFDFEGEDLEELNKALDDEAYYVEFDKYDLVYEPTLLSIIHGLPAYL